MCALEMGTVTKKRYKDNPQRNQLIQIEIDQITHILGQLTQVYGQPTQVFRTTHPLFGQLFYVMDSNGNLYYVLC